MRRSAAVLAKVLAACSADFRVAQKMRAGLPLLKRSSTSKSLSRWCDVVNRQPMVGIDGSHLESSVWSKTNSFIRSLF